MEEVKTTYLFKRKPTTKLARKDTNNAALCGFKTINPKSAFSLVNM